MKKLLLNIVLTILIVIVLYTSITFFSEKNNTVSSPIMDVTRQININDLNIKVRYILGNMIDEQITFGNILEKKIEISNPNDEQITYSITFKEVEINNEKLTYSLKASTDEENYTYISKNTPVTSDMHIGYNLVIDPNTKLYLTIEFKANAEEPTTIKGILDVSDNLSDKDLFVNNTRLIKTQIDEKINAINGIVKPGIYLVNLNELSDEIYEKYKGYVLIDAKDYTQLEYVFYIYSTNHMLKGYVYDNNFDKSVITPRDKEISALNDQTVCSIYSKDLCTKLNTLKYNTLGTKTDFYNNAKAIIDNVKSINTSNNNVIVYDVTKDIDNKTKIRGYILADNTKQETEYYLYLTDNIYMISGYNITKNGEFTTESTTIRAYNETAFNLSSLSPTTVCTFSGFTNCLTK